MLSISRRAFRQSRCRFFSTQFQTVQDIFNRNVKRMQRDVAAANPNFKKYDYLRDETARRLLDRLDDTLYKFPIALDLGCSTGSVRRHLSDRGGIEHLYQCDTSKNMVHLAETEPVQDKLTPPTTSLVADEEFLPFGPESLDLVISNLSLHWVNDLPGCFAQIRKSLKPNGMFLGCMLGGTTLNELRQSLTMAEQQSGGVGIHVSPMVGIADAGNLVSGAGFTLPTADVDTITYSYKDMFELMDHLKGMGESNACRRRYPTIRKSVLEKAAQYYQQNFAGGDGVIATFQVMYFIGWAPHESQPKPLERGSAKFSLSDIPNFKHGELQ